MSGQFLRRGTPPAERHECRPPERAYCGDVWACDCGQRWTCVGDYAVLDLPESQKAPGFEPHVEAARWERRYWPWPRASRPATPGPDTVDRIEQVGHPSGGLTD